MRYASRSFKPLASLAGATLLILAPAAAGHADDSAVSASLANPTGMTIAVKNCNNSGPGSLRAAVASALNADTIDLRGLTCRRIKLTGAIAVTQNDLTLLGPGLGMLIDGNRESRVLRHSGSGTLHVKRLTIANGYSNDEDGGSGGCIYAEGNVTLRGSRVHHCRAEATSGLEPYAAGGGIFALGNVSLYHSGVFANAVVGDGEGGGVYTFGRLTVDHSFIGDNHVPYGQAGGASVHEGLTTNYASISRNTARKYGGMYVRAGTMRVANSAIIDNKAVDDVGGAALMSTTALVVNSTISGNAASYASGLLMAGSVANSTIAFNTETEFGPDNRCDGALLGGDLHLESTIVASNACDSGAPIDVGGNPQFGHTLVGANNLIGSSSLDVPADTISADPRLAPLANNGGSNKTHALLDDSPAIDAGNNAAGLAYDQRGRGFPRVKGAQADIGAYER